MNRHVLCLSTALILSTAFAVGVALFAASGISRAEPSGSGTTQGETTAATTTTQEPETTSGSTAGTTEEATSREESSEPGTGDEAADTPENTSGGTSGKAAAGPQELEDALNGEKTPSGTPSQGSLRNGPEGPELPDTPDYSQVVDNTSSGAFEAPGWRSSGQGKDIHGKNYQTRDSSPAGEASGVAKYEFEIPTTDVYTIFAWWPSVAGADSAAQVETDTGDGIERETVDQSVDAGYWVPVGQYKMVEGDRRAVEISSGEDGGKVVADAMAVVRGISDLPKNPEKIGNNTGGTAVGGETTFGGAAWGKPIPRNALMKRGKRHLGTRYVYGGRDVCRVGVSMDCTCFTSRVYRKYRRLPDSPPGQWTKKGKFIYSKGGLRRGDVVIFDENRNGKLEPWDHAGMYAGNGNVMHASSYFGKVVISKMKYLNGFKGGKRWRYQKVRF